MVLDAYWEQRQRHLAGNIFDMHANHVNRGNALAWFASTTDGFVLRHTLAEADQITEQYRSCQTYKDAHAWKFTPSSFALIVQDLRELKLIRLGAIDSISSYGFEFYVTLKKDHVATPASRLVLLQACQRELAGAALGPDNFR